MDLWRLTPAKNKERAFNGDGASEYGGRWNHRGIAAVYTSCSLALCTLEVLAHFDTQLFPRYFEYRVKVPSSVKTSSLENDLPDNWRVFPAMKELQDIGSEWLLSMKSCALRVPSAVVPSESNWILNPRHPDFEHLIIFEPKLYEFDPRLL